MNGVGSGLPADEGAKEGVEVVDSSVTPSFLRGVRAWNVFSAAINPPSVCITREGSS